MATKYYVKVRCKSTNKSTIIPRTFPSMRKAQAHADKWNDVPDTFDFAWRNVLRKPDFAFPVAQLVRECRSRHHR